MSQKIALEKYLSGLHNGITNDMAGTNSENIAAAVVISADDDGNGKDHLQMVAEQQ